MIHKEISKAIIFNFIIIASFFLILEEITTHLYLHPEKLKYFSPKVRTVFSRAYSDGRIKIRETRCKDSNPLMIYNEKLSYILAPNNQCEISSPEFINIYNSNSFGLRDDEKDLKKAEIIAIGDSFTMGEGVNYSKRYTDIIESKSGKKVLTAGISSYGTAREVELLNMLDRSNLKYLIIQYHRNDIRENKAYIKNNFLQKPTLKKEEYEEIRSGKNFKDLVYRIEQHLPKWHNSFYFYETLRTGIKFLRKFNRIDNLKEEEIKEISKDHAQNFIAILENAFQTRKIPKNIKLIIFPALDSPHQYKYPKEEDGNMDAVFFIEEVNNLAKSSKIDALRKATILNPLQEAVVSQDAPYKYHHLLDGHANDLGQEMIAKEILKSVNFK